MAASESELKLEVKPKKGVFYACMLSTVCNKYLTEKNNTALLVKPH